MPCLDDRDCIREVSKQSDLNEIERLQGNNNYLDAVLCAMSNFVHSIGKLSEMVDYAKASSEIDIKPFLDEHRRADKAKMMRTLKDNYSQDEIDLIISMAKADEIITKGDK